MADAAKRIYELMVLVAWADGTVEASEALAVHEAVTSRPELADLGKKSEISRGAKALLDEFGLDGALRKVGAQLADAPSKELAFLCCARVLEADGEMSGAEAGALGTLQEVFGLSPADVKRLLAEAKPAA